jgi:hypothetical protein
MPDSGMKSTALELLDKAVLALEAEGYEFTARKLYRTSTCGMTESRTKQVIELRCYRQLPAQEIPPEFKALTGFWTGRTY